MDLVLGTRAEYQILLAPHEERLLRARGWRAPSRLRAHHERQFYSAVCSLGQQELCGCRNTGAGTGRSTPKVQ